MATLGGTAALAFFSTRGGSKDKSTPPIQASSGDEEKFIRYASCGGWARVQSLTVG